MTLTAIAIMVSARVKPLNEERMGRNSRMGVEVFTGGREGATTLMPLTGQEGRVGRSRWVLLTVRNGQIREEIYGK